MTERKGEVAGRAKRNDERVLSEALGVCCMKIDDDDDDDDKCKLGGARERQEVRRSVVEAFLLAGRSCRC